MYSVYVRMVCDVCMDVAITDHGVPLSGLPMLLQRYRDQMQGEDTNIEHRRECERGGNGEMEVEVDVEVDVTVEVRCSGP